MKKMSVRTRLVCMFTLVAVLFSTPFMLNVVSAIGISENIDSSNQAFIEELVNAYADLDFKLTVAKMVSLKDSDGESRYTFVKLSPYGYAIIEKMKNILIEACFTEGVILPFDVDSDLEYYYMGPRLVATKYNDGFVSAMEGENLSLQTIENAKMFENRIASISEPQVEYANNAGINAIPPTITHTNSVAPSYFQKLLYFGRNTEGTCTVVAATILFGYYKHNVHTAYMSDDYVEPACEPESAGTTEEFHQLLCNYVYGSGTRKGIKIGAASTGFNSYLASRSLPVRIVYNASMNVRDTQAKIVSLIDDNRPAMASYGTAYGASDDHTVVVYGYKYTTRGNIETSSTSDPAAVVNYATLTFRVHMGHMFTDENDVWLTSSWFYQYGYITSCTETGTHYKETVRYTGDNYHRNDYHYYERETACCSCGGNVQYEWVRQPCDCVDITQNFEEKQ